MIVAHVCEFYVFVLLYLCLVDGRLSVSIYLLFSCFSFSRKGLTNQRNEHFSVFELFKMHFKLKFCTCKFFEK